MKYLERFLVDFILFAVNSQKIPSRYLDIAQNF